MENGEKYFLWNERREEKWFYPIGCCEEKGGVSREQKNDGGWSCVRKKRERGERERNSQNRVGDEGNRWEKYIDW